MSKRVVAVALGIMLSIPAIPPAFAQSNPGRQTGSSAPSQGVMTPDLRRRTTQEGFRGEFDNRRANDTSSVRGGADAIASCVVRRGGDQAGSYIGGALAGDPDYKRIGDVLNGRFRNCTTDAAAASASNISSALAEQLLAKQAPALQDRAPSVSEDAAHKFFGNLEGPVTLDNIAGCQAVYSPGLVYKLLQTSVGSSDEAAALQAIYRQTPECRMSAPPEGIDTLYQRSVLATALYKWTNPGA